MIVLTGGVSIVPWQHFPNQIDDLLVILVLF